MTNPFKFGSVVEDSFFTNRSEELNFVAKTIDSSIKRLMLNGCVIKTDNSYKLDAPFFKQWIVERRNQ